MAIYLTGPEEPRTRPPFQWSLTPGQREAEPVLSIVTRLVCHVKNHPNAVVMMQAGRMFRSCPDCTFQSKGIDLAPGWRMRAWLAGDPDGPKVPIGVPEMQIDLDNPGTRRLLQALIEGADDPVDPPRGPIFTADERTELFTGKPVGKRSDDDTEDDY